MPASIGSISRTSIQDYSRNPRVTYILITGLVSLIAVLHLLPAATQHSIASQFSQHPWLLAVILIVILGLTYFNWIAGLLMLFLVLCVLFPMTTKEYGMSQLVPGGNIYEGFAASGSKKGKAENDISLNNGHIKSLFEPGLLGKGVEDARAANKKFKAENAAREKSIQVLNSKRAEKLGSNNTGRAREKENFKEIELRRFDPTSEDDMNLLLTMEHCSDIQNRVKYVYEDNKYLKKYIRDKLEDIVDLLDLVPDEAETTN